jgi:hypothetical protein
VTSNSRMQAATEEAIKNGVSGTIVVVGEV